MEIPNHSLPQITPEVLGKLNPDDLLKLSVKLLKDLKELHDRLNQDSDNSSRPSSSIPPWEKKNSSKKNADESTENMEIELEESPSEAMDKNNKQNDSSNEANCNNLSTSIKALQTFSSQGKNTEKLPPNKPGKQKGAPGYGRTWNPKATEEIIHCTLETCIGICTK